MAKKARPKAVQKEKEFKRVRSNFKELERGISSSDFVKIASFLYHNDYDNPTRFEIYNEYEHSFVPKKKIHSFSSIAKYWIVEIWYKMREIEAKEAEAARIAKARKKKKR